MVSFKTELSIEYAKIEGEYLILPIRCAFPFTKLSRLIAIWNDDNHAMINWLNLLKTTATHCIIYW